MADRALLSGGLAALLEDAHLTVPDDLAVLIAEHAKSLDAADAALYVVDYEQLVLVPVPNPAGPAREEVLIDTTLAGRCYRTLEMQQTSTPYGGWRVWVPLLDGAARLGVLEFEFGAAHCRDDDAMRAFASWWPSWS